METHNNNSDKQIQDSISTISENSTSETFNRQVRVHWFIAIENHATKYVPFPLIDSEKIEKAYQNSEQLTFSERGMYDIDVDHRIRKAIFWEEPNRKIHRCSWFYHGDSGEYQPYSESISVKLNHVYEQCLENGTWHTKLPVSEDEYVFLKDKDNMFRIRERKDYFSVDLAKGYPALSSALKVHHGLPSDFQLEESDPEPISHLMFVVHGIGEICDLKLRRLKACLDDMDEIAMDLQHSYFKPHFKEIGKIEFIPVSWHSCLHTEAINETLDSIALPSITKIRKLCNSAVSDIIFYSNPYYFQIIVNTVCSRLNAYNKLFKERNPDFKGKVSVMGHSLGSVILFDILANQTNKSIMNQLPADKNINLESFLRSLELEKYVDLFLKEELDFDTLLLLNENDLKLMGIPMGPTKKIVQALSELKGGSHGNQKVRFNTPEMQTIKILREDEIYFPNVPSLDFHPSIFFAIGAPISLFLVTRGYEKISKQFRLPTCSKFYNIFHPFDPVAYRLETMMNPSLLKPEVIATNIKQKPSALQMVVKKVKSDFFEMVKPLLTPVRSKSPTPSNNSDHSYDKNDTAKYNNFWGKDKLICADFESDDEENRNNLGNLNQGERFDYSLPESALESMTEYAFSIIGHSCYWTSKLFIYFIMRKMYEVEGFVINDSSDSDSDAD